MLRWDKGSLALLAAIRWTHAPLVIKQADTYVPLDPLQVARSVQHIPGPSALVGEIKATLASEADGHSDYWACMQEIRASTDCSLYYKDRSQGYGNDL